LTCTVNSIGKANHRQNLQYQLGNLSETPETRQKCKELGPGGGYPHSVFLSSLTSANHLGNPPGSSHPPVFASSAGASEATLLPYCMRRVASEAILGPSGSFEANLRPQKRTGVASEAGRAGKHRGVDRARRVFNTAIIRRRVGGGAAQRRVQGISDQHVPGLFPSHSVFHSTVYWRNFCRRV
jgi:hypothetical protein